MQVDFIKVGSRYRKDMGDIDDLVDSIRSLGLLQPIVVDGDGNLIAGERRLMACVRLGWRDIPARIVELDPDKYIDAEADENAVRKNFTPTEAAAIRNARLAREQERAKERQGTRTDKHGGKFPQGADGKARDKAAAGTGYSGRTLDKAAAVEEAAAADPELEPLVKKMDETGKVDAAYQEMKAKKAAAASGKRKKAQADKDDAELARTALTKTRTKYGHVAYWQPVWDAIDALNEVAS